MITHLYIPDPTTPADHKGARPCLRCPLPRSNRVHDVVDHSDEERAVDARRLGEGGTGDD
jgi:methylphosphotriester-DNA--protein-cysteine methyltransferase